MADSSFNKRPKKDIRTAMKTDVLIVGAGPVGLTMAIELARYGVKVRIIDKAAARSDKSKALVIWTRTLELMERAGCSAALVNAGRKVNSVKIIADGRSVGQFTLSGIETKYPYGLLIPQSETERILDEFLNGLGVKIQRSVEVADFAASGDKVLSVLRLADGHREMLETSWLIGCDGAHSTVRHMLGMIFHGETILIDWILADVTLKSVPEKSEIVIVWHPDGLLALFPLAENRYRVIADVGAIEEGADPRPAPTVEEVQALLDKRYPGIQASDPIWLSTFRINERKVRNYRSGRVFLAGDAAHVHSPAGARGMNTGMHDAINLAWKLGLVVQGKASKKILDSYTPERGPIAEEMLKMTERAKNLAAQKGKFVQFLCNHTASLVLGFAPVREAATNRISQISIGYPDSPLTVKGEKFHGDLTAGERAPIRDGEPPVGAGEEPRFALFAADGNTMLGELLKQYPDLLEPKIRPPFEADGIWLVRPDGYVGVAARRGDEEVIANYLNELKARSENEQGFQNAA